MNTKEIVKEYLKNNGYDGLINENGDCGCLIDDLVPCMDGDGFDNCIPGYKTPCDCSEHYGWHVSAKK